MIRKVLLLSLAIGASQLFVLGAAEAGTCQSVKAKGVAAKLATATAYAQADLRQTAKVMRGKVTQTSTNCAPASSGYKCKIEAVVCPR